MTKVLLALRRYGNSFVNFPWMLARAGLQVDVVITRSNYLKYSRWINRSFLVENDNGAFNKMVRERLLTGEYSFFQIVDEPALKSIYSDPELSSIVQYLPFPPDSPLAKVVGRKDVFQTLCEANGIPTPITRRVSSWAETEAACAELGFPCFIKGVSGSGGMTVFELNTISEARAVMGKVEKDPVWLVQEKIPGPVASASFLSYRGQLKAWMSGNKHVCLNKGMGPSVVRTFTQNPHAGRLCGIFSQLGPINGLTGFDYLERPSGEVVAIDPHFGRSPPITHLGLFCGVDFGAALKEACNGDSRVINPSPCDLRIVKYPEIIEYTFQEGVRKFFQSASPWDRKIRYSFGPDGDWQLFARMTVDSLLACSKVKLGGWKARLLGRPS